MAKKQATNNPAPAPIPTQAGLGPSADDVAVADKIRAAARKDPIIGVILTTLYDKGPLMFTKLVEEVHRQTLVGPGRIEGRIAAAKGFGLIDISPPPLMVCSLNKDHSVGMVVIREFSTPSAT